jgi:hypothetical protein
VVKSENGALRCWTRKLVAEPLQLGWSELTVVITGHRRVKSDHSQAIKIPHSVLRLRCGRASKEHLREGFTLIVVAHDPDHWCP